MRAALWLLVLFGVAVAGALVIGENRGTVSVFWHPYRVDLSLNLVLAGLVALFFIIYFALRALAVLFAMPERARLWRQQRRERALHTALLDSLSHLVAGRFIRAKKAAEQVLSQETTLAEGAKPLAYAGRLRVLSHLLAAESAHALQDKTAREAHLNLALEHAAKRDTQVIREGVQLRAARWAFDDRDAQAATHWLDQLPQGAARRTLALRLRLKVARLARNTRSALETARLLTKHGAFSASASHSLVRGLALDLLRSAYDTTQLRTAWEQLDAAERLMPDVAMEAVQRMMDLGGDALMARKWLLPVWDLMVKEPQGWTEEQRLKLVRTLERTFAQEAGAPDSSWLNRIEAAQMANPRDAGLQYLAGVACMHLELWGKAQQLLAQSVARLKDPQMARNAWRALAELAEQRDDAKAALDAYRNAAKR
jgi:HemY protein